MDPLESNTSFSRLPADLMSAVQSVRRERTFAAGQTIFREGDSGDGVYVIKSGTVEISVRVGSHGERKVFAREGPGSLFGEMAIIDNQPRSASAIAGTETVVYFIPREAMLAVMAKSPEFMTQLMQGITRRLREFNHRYANEVLQSERLALVGRFTRSIVHDLKNPLNVIGIAADIAASDHAPPEMRRTGRDRIRKQINRINALVNEVVEFTRSTQATFILAPTDYHQLVHQVIEDLRQELSLSAAELKLLNEPPRVKVAANPERLLRVFQNLCVNASEAMPEGGVVSVGFELVDNQVCTTVSDTGRGIPAEIADTLFTAFVTHGKPNGTGLGLSICQRIIEDHHGRITAKNAPGGGASFTFTLPVIAAGGE